MSVLDIGSGLCVFLAELKKYCKSVTCIDPSANAINHAKNYVGVPHVDVCTIGANPTEKGSRTSLE